MPDHKTKTPAFSLAMAAGGAAGGGDPGLRPGDLVFALLVASAACNDAEQDAAYADITELWKYNKGYPARGSRGTACCLPYPG